MGDVLSADEVRKIRNAASAVALMDPGPGGLPYDLAAVCESHETLRSLLDRALTVMEAADHRDMTLAAAQIRAAANEAGS